MVDSPALGWRVSGPLKWPEDGWDDLMEKTMAVPFQEDHAKRIIRYLFGVN